MEFNIRLEDKEDLITKRYVKRQDLQSEIID
jgi:hypothetical protein